MPKRDNLLGDFYGDHAVSAPAAIVATRTDTAEGVERTMIGGVVLNGFGGKNWERWRGTMIFIPRFIDVTRQGRHWSVQDLMMQGINRDGTLEEMKDPDSFWKSKWRAQ